MEDVRRLFDDTYSLKWLNQVCRAFEFEFRQSKIDIGFCCITVEISNNVSEINSTHRCHDVINICSIFRQNNNQRIWRFVWNRNPFSKISYFPPVEFSFHCHHFSLNRATWSKERSRLSFLESVHKFPLEVDGWSQSNLGGWGELNIVQFKPALCLRFGPSRNGPAGFFRFLEINYKSSHR